MVDTIIRPARRTDGRVIGEMWLELLEEMQVIADFVAPSEDAIDRWLVDFTDWVSDDERLIRIATQGENAAGFISALIYRTPPMYRLVSEVFVSEIYVHPEYRGKGIGRLLFEEVKAWGQDLGVSRLRATVLSKSAGSVDFWLACGAEPVTADYVVPIVASGGSSRQRRVKLGF